MKKLSMLVFVLWLLMAAGAKAQLYAVPVNYEMVSLEDYVRYEPNIISTVDWLQQTSWVEDGQKWRAATDFLFKWIQGTPTITIELMPTLMTLTDRNNKLLATFMGGYVKYAIQHPGYHKDDANLAAVQDLIVKYQAEHSHTRDRDIEQLLKLDKAGLADWVKNEYNKSAASQ